MPDVISDTSPIQYLHQVELLDLLFRLYEEITIPKAVENEIAEGRDHGIDLPGVEEMSRFKVRTASFEQTVELPTSLGRANERFLPWRLLVQIPSCCLTTHSPDSTLGSWVLDSLGRWVFC